MSALVLACEQSMTWPDVAFAAVGCAAIGFMLWLVLR